MLKNILSKESTRQSSEIRVNDNSNVLAQTNWVDRKEHNLQKKVRFLFCTVWDAYYTSEYRYQADIGTQSKVYIVPIWPCQTGPFLN